MMVASESLNNSMRKFNNLLMKEIFYFLFSLLWLSFIALQTLLNIKEMKIIIKGSDGLFVFYYIGRILNICTIDFFFLVHETVNKKISYLKKPIPDKPSARLKSMLLIQSWKCIIGL